jgi:hypothetical protein
MIAVHNLSEFKVFKKVLELVIPLVNVVAVHAAMGDLVVINT